MSATPTCGVSTWRYGCGDQVLHSWGSTAFNSCTSYNLRHPQPPQSELQTCKVCLKSLSVPLFSFKPAEKLVFPGLNPAQTLREEHQANSDN